MKKLPTKQKGYTSAQLTDYCQIETSIECSNCRAIEACMMGDESMASDEFFEKGWRATKGNNCYCPECAMKKLKS
jgi:hypothetical protein